MEAEIAADIPLDYVTFQILPENRYNAYICSKEKEDGIGDGPLDQLLEHLPNIKDQVAKESCDRFKLELPDNIDQKAWFTKATLTRFLHIIGSSDSLNKAVAISKEMSQLEVARKFHLSLYAKAEDGIRSSDSSKNELLQAMDSRLAALMEDLVSTFNVASGGATFSFLKMMDLHKFCQYFGDEDISNLLLKLSETSQKGQILVPVDNKKSSVPLMSKNDYANKTGGNIKISDSSNSVKPVTYNASPAKAAEVERQSSTTESEEDPSFSSEDEPQPSVERSRTLIRSASPRRSSASPMRRVQIGRSGPRRTPALTIKSLTCFPARERVSSRGDNLEESEEPNKKTEVNVTRISVQDAISLFESKQRVDGANDTQKRSLVDSSTKANKSVLRRWSSGSMGVAQNIPPENTASENVVDEVKPEMNPVSENPESEEIVKVMESETSEKTESPPIEDDVPISQPEKINEKIDSVEWSRQKEVELSQMLMKLAEYKDAEPDNKKRNSSLKQRGEKLRGENGGKRAQSEFRPKQKVLDDSKAAKPSVKPDDVGKKHTTSRSPNVNKNPPLSSNSKREPPKPDVPKKAPSKSSSLPATRKSWPSTLSPRAMGALPAKIPTGTPSGITAPRQKPKSPAPLSRPGPKLERPQIQQQTQLSPTKVGSGPERPQTQQRNVKKVQIETTKSVKRVDDSKNRVAPRSGKTTQSKLAMAPEEDAGSTPVKAVVQRRKVVKKSSVVPLEAKPSTRMVSGPSPARNPTEKKTEIPTQVEETLSKSEDPTGIQEEGNPASEIHNGNLAWGDLHSTKEKAKEGSEEETVEETPAHCDEIAERMSKSPEEIHPVEETPISPAAWEESNDQEPSNQSDVGPAPSPPNHELVASSGPRVRHSLSQMLLEESSEPDMIGWGNAENPPTMVYQKDAPKGLKRLLKFARKNKGEANGTAWANPYTSEGEDEGDECKSLGKRNSDNLLRKVALHSKNYGEGLLSDSEAVSARSNASNSSARSSNKFQEGHTTSKGTRSFFSLSAFRGDKN